MRRSTRSCRLSVRIGCAASLSCSSRSTRIPLTALSGPLAELGEEADNLAHQRAAGCRRIIAIGDAFVYLAERRIGRNPADHRLDLHFLRDGQRPHLDQLAGLRPDDRGAEDRAVLGRDDLDVADGLALGLGAVVLVVGPTQHVDLARRLLGLGLDEARRGRARDR